MATITVKSPNTTFTGVKAGVVFNRGEAKLDDKNDGAALAYFEGAGYSVGSKTADVREDLPVDRVAAAPQTFDAPEDEQPSRIDVAVPGPSAGLKEWQVFARGYNLLDEAKSKDKDAIITRVRALGLI